MPQPDDITDGVDDALTVWREARVRVETVLAGSVGEPDRRRLRAALREVDAAIDAIETATREDQATRVPQVFARGAADGGVPIVNWSQTSRAAVEALARQNFDELLAATRHVRRTSKVALRQLAKAGALDVLTQGQTANKAGLAVTDLVQDAADNVLTVTYRNGAKHALADYADTALRTQTAKAYNAGALDGYATAGIEWIEIADGPDCGLTKHDDGEIANGMVVPYALAMEYPIAHPRCARSLLPRPDLSDAKAAKAHNDARDMDALAAESLAERQRAARATVTGRRMTVDSETRRVARRSRAPRSDRKPRAV